MRLSGNTGYITTNRETITSTKHKRRSIELVIVNCLKEDVLQLDDEMFSSGTWYSQIGQVKIAPGCVGRGTVAGRAQSVLTGVSGGLAFRIGDKPGSDLIFAIGFTNPLLGCDKTAVVIKSGGKAKDGYSAVFDDSMKSIRKEVGLELRLLCHPPPLQIRKWRSP